MASQCRQNFSEEVEAGINKQINMELYASYVYLAMSYHFDRDDVALPNVSKFFKKQSDDEREHAQLLMKYQNKRGGRIVLQDVKKPADVEFDSAQQAFEKAVALEKQVNQALLELHDVADTHNDKQFQDFLESNFLEEQVDSIKELGDLVTRAKKCGPGLGEFLFDKHAFSDEEEG